MDFILQTLTIIFWFIIILVPLVAIHEFGHLLMARLVGVKVLEYGIGAPPRWIYFRWKGIVWSLNYLIFLGGFARIYGDHDAIDEAHELAKTDKKEAKTAYIPDRISELVANQELRFFLEENSLEYDKDWAELEKSKYIRGKEVESEKDKQGKFELLTNQLKTLVEWEFDTKINSKETFFSKNWLQQTIILLGGVTFNLLTAVTLFWIIFGITGSMAQYAFPSDSNEITKYANISSRSEYIKVPSVAKDGVADKIGIKPGDDLISIDNKDTKNINSIGDFRNTIKELKGKEVPITFKAKDSGEVKTVNTTLEEKNGEVLLGVAGIGYETKYKAKNFISGFLLSVNQTWDFVVLDFKALGQIFTALLPQTQDRAALEYVSGPIAVSSFSSKIFKDYGISGILYLMALISIGLAAFNVLPIPALDGGRWVIITINKILGRRNKKWEAVAISITFLLLLILGAFIAVKDVQGIIAGKY